MIDRNVVVAGSYAPADEPGIRAFGIDVEAGRFVELGGWDGVANPSFLATAVDGRHLYAVSETGAGSVRSYAVTWWDGRPDLVAGTSVPSGGDHPCHLGVDPAGRWLATANYGSGDVGIVGLDASGDLTILRSAVRHHGAGPDPTRQAAPHVHAARPSVDGRHLIVADLGADRIAVYAVDDRSGALTLRSDAVVAPGAGPRHVAAHPDGRLVAVANELDGTVTTYLLDATTGTLERRETASTLPTDPPTNLVADIHFDTGGRRLYVSNRGHDSIATFAVTADGRLSRTGIDPCGGSWPRSFAVLPDGRHLVVANERSDELVLLATTDDGVGDAVARIAMLAPTCVVPLAT